MTNLPGSIFPTPPQRPRVLIVDDEPNIRSLLRRALAGGGFDLFEAPDGETAYEILRTVGADVVLSDLLMPGMKGTDLLRLAKAHDDAVGFIILTGVGTMENAIEALRLQADDYLLKPFNLDEVTLSVERALKHLWNREMPRRVYEPRLIPGAVSHGCVRVPNRAIRRLARLLTVGTPIRIAG